MRYAILLATVSVLAYLMGAMLNCVGIPRVLLIYVGWLFSSTAIAFFALQRVAHSERGYAYFFLMVMLPAVALALFQTLAWAARSMDFYTGFILMTAMFFVCGCIVQLILKNVGTNLARDIRLMEGYALVICGVLTLASLIAPVSLLDAILRVTFGSYWLLIGVYDFVDSVGMVRSRSLFESVGGWLPSALCIVWLGCLAVWLTFHQMEAGRQEIRGQFVAQRYVEEEVR